MTNHLISENSPYLLQHANNPVEWHPWGEEALNKAKKENKPIFLSVGYAACHWCHVMEHESFEDPKTAAIMNANFINIKVDREERPDLDNIYMQATVAMTGSGGWPMSVFLTPELKPFYAGTYFPPVRRYNMPSFTEVLEGLANAWQNEQEEIKETSQKVHSHISASQETPAGETITQEHLNAISTTIQKSYDWKDGGWGGAPKFPQPMLVEFLLHNTHTSKNNIPYTLINHYLHAMARGGMYDVVGGGFSRYSTDAQWRVPHFEKMLYDNALLTRAYLHAWQVTRNPFYKQIVEETLGFIANEMTHPQGGFYSSLDADSEGEEGKFYTWSLEEIRNTLKKDSDLFEAAYGVTANGNWEGKTVLQRVINNTTLAARFQLDEEIVQTKLAESHSRLYSARAKRIRPATDDKVLTAWNGLMLAAIAEAARTFAETDVKTGNILTMATRNADFLLTHLRPNGELKRSWRNGKTTNEVFLEDYAALILGLLELYQTDFNPRWFHAAKELTDEMIENFSDSKGGFFDTKKSSTALLFRPKDIQDNATPSGNALACEALIKMAAYTGEGHYRDLAEKSLEAMAALVHRYPLGFGKWLTAAQLATGTLKQVVIVAEAGDPNFQRLLQATRSVYAPNSVTAASSTSKSESLALLQNRSIVNERATAYICEGFICNQPTNETDALLQQLVS